VRNLVEENAILLQHKRFIPDFMLSIVTLIGDVCKTYVF